ncbi:MAG: hypothetical protein ACLQUY_11945 [Ktedonobacterales bacterium]
MTLAFLPFAPVIRYRSSFLEGGLPGKLVERSPERFDTGIAPMRKLLHLIYGELKSGKPFDPSVALAA